MSERNSFIGLNGFIWWVGRIEDIGDPLGLNRCRVRIFGWHTDNEELLPKDQLPWAGLLMPINQSLTSSLPNVGDWVAGFFMDGESAQFPIMMGVISGINPELTK